MKLLLLACIPLLLATPADDLTVDEIWGLIYDLESESAETRAAAERILLERADETLSYLRHGAKVCGSARLRQRCRELVRAERRNAAWSRIRLAFRDPIGGRLVIRDGAATIRTSIDVDRAIPNPVAFSPDGRIVYCYQGYDLIRYEIGGTSLPTVTYQVDAGGDGIEVSPDGKWVLVHQVNSWVSSKDGAGNNPAKLIVIDAGTGEPVDDLQHSWVAATWLDKRAVIFHDGKALRTWRPGSGTGPTAHDDVGLPLGPRMAASPDATRVALLTGSGGISVLELEKGDLVEVARVGVSGEKMIAWSPDGQKLAFLEEDRLAVFDVADAGEPHPVSIRAYQGQDLLGWMDDTRVVLLRRDRIDHPIAHLGHADTEVYCDVVVVDVRSEEPRDPILYLTRGGPIVDRATLVTLPGGSVQFGPPR